MVDQSHILRRKALASMLSEALCSRAKRVSEMRASSSKSTNQIMGSGSSLLLFPQLSIIPEETNNSTTVSLLSSQSSSPASSSFSSLPPTPPRSRSGSRSRNSSPRTRTRHLQETELDPETRIETNEIPFAFRAKQAGRVFRGGKQDGQFNSIQFSFFFAFFSLVFSFRLSTLLLSEKLLYHFSNSFRSSHRSITGTTISTSFLILSRGLGFVSNELFLFPDVLGFFRCSHVP